MSGIDYSHIPKKEREIMMDMGLIPREEPKKESKPRKKRKTTPVQPVVEEPVYIQPTEEERVAKLEISKDQAKEQEIVMWLADKLGLYILSTETESDRIKNKHIRFHAFQNAKEMVTDEHRELYDRYHS